MRHLTQTAGILVLLKAYSEDVWIVTGFILRWIRCSGCKTSLAYRQTTMFKFLLLQTNILGTCRWYCLYCNRCILKLMYIIISYCVVCRILTGRGTSRKQVILFHIDMNVFIIIVLMSFIILAIRVYHFNFLTHSHYFLSIFVHVGI